MSIEREVDLAVVTPPGKLGILIIYCDLGVTELALDRFGDGEHIRFLGEISNIYEENPVATILDVVYHYGVEKIVLRGSDERLAEKILEQFQKIK